VTDAASSILVVDDEPFVRESIVEVLRSEGWRTHAASGAKEAVEFLARQGVDVVVTDLRMPEGDAFLLLEHAKKDGFDIPIVVITGVGTVSEAVRAMKAGAYDFLQKPVDPDELLLLARRAAEHRRLLGEVRALRETIQGLRAPRVLVGRSPRMETARAAIAQVARTDATVLVRGESGTGKELAAEEVHRQSARAAGPFVRLHCAAASEESFEKELFEEGSGAFTRAEGGTLVLDEVGVLTPNLQAKLLKLLEAPETPASPRAIGVRLVAITNDDLSSRVKSGTFRADLYWRLAVFPIEMPALREHKEDIPELVEHFLAWARRRTGAGIGAAPTRGVRATEKALEVLATYAWPGNVRELRNVLERAAILAGDRELDDALLRGILESAVALPEPAGASSPREFHLRKNLDAAEKEILLRALAHTHGKKKEASLLLGIDPRNLGYYLRKHGIAEAKGREDGET
jgi:DNA-binding NtrC family response regulator